jgi:hypothetical protein
LIFGVGALKLSKMVNILTEVSFKMVESFRGVKDKRTGFYAGGEASDLANGQLRMTRAQFPTGVKAEWGENRKMTMMSLFGNPLPYVLSPVYAGNGDITTRCNSTIQSGDVAFMNYITGRAALEFNLGTFDGRFAHSVHDNYLWIIKDEHVNQFVEFIGHVHSQCYLKLFKTWNVDLKSVPENIWYPETIDVSQRWLKKMGDESKAKSETISFEGFSGVEGDDDWDSDEEGAYEFASDYD